MPDAAGEASRHRPAFLIPRVHEGSAPSLGAKVGIAQRRTGLVAAKALQQEVIRPESRRATPKLARMAKEHSSAAMERLDQTAHLDVHVAILGEFADQRTILIQADDREAAAVVRGLWRTHIEKPRPIRKLRNVIDMDGNADVLVE